MSKSSFTVLLNSARSCTICEAELKDGVRPVLQVHPESRILIAGQAPGVKVHQSGIPFDDASGNRLREWMGIGRELFYDEKRVAVLPMGFCYPGKGRSGDLPPRKICADTWREQLISGLPNIKLTLVIGQYAHAWHLPFTGKNLSATVSDWRSYPDDLMPLPHPSPRNNIWLKKNPWFESDVLPGLRRKVHQSLNPG